MEGGSIFRSISRSKSEERDSLTQALAPTQTLTYRFYLRREPGPNDPSQSDGYKQQRQQDALCQFCGSEEQEL